MKIFTDKLDGEHFKRITDAMGIELYECTFLGRRVRGKYKGKTCFAVSLRPINDRFRKANRQFGQDKMRRAWAISWAGHYVFMRAMFELDNDAVLVSAGPNGYGGWGNEYKGLEGFLENAPGTCYANVGSLAAPLEYMDAQAPAHLEWDYIEDLDEMAMEVLKGELEIRSRLSIDVTTKPKPETKESREREVNNLLVGLAHTSKA